jgi:hypothetical protein
VGTLVAAVVDPGATLVLKEGKAVMANNPYSDREVLDIFIETVEELQASEFAKQIKGGIRVGLKAGNAVIISELAGPDREALKAFLLTLRFFRQNNEETSLRNMATRVAGLNVDQGLKDEFLTSRDNFNAFLDGPLAVPVNGVGADSKRDVFESFLYGVYAHANPDHRRRVKGWEKLPFYADLEAQFLLTVAHFTAAVTSMAETCRKMLASGAV